MSSIADHLRTEKRFAELESKIQILVDRIEHLTKRLDNVTKVEKRNRRDAEAA